MDPDQTRAPDRLLLEFCGEEHVVADRSTVGRCGDLAVDENPYLHRVVFVVERERTTWWLRNVGSRIVLEVLDADGSSSATVGPGSSMALVHRAFTIRFRGGAVPYEIEGVLEAADRAVDLAPPDGTPTLEWGRVELNADQRLLLAGLCEQRLRHPADRWAPVPANRSVAHRLGWSVNKLNRKLDHLCEKLDRAGVPGLHGDLGLLATDRRRRLVDHAVDSGLIDRTDLGLLEVDDVPIEGERGALSA